MERRSWLWKRKSTAEKSPGETESSGSVSSDRYLDEQDGLRGSSVNSSPGLVQSPEVTSKGASGKNGENPKVLAEKSPGGEDNETVKSLAEKLSAALSTIAAKEELVRQHSTVAEEAVLGWEKAENEVVSLKQQLDAFIKKNSSLEDKVSHLDGALKECVRQLRQSREEQEEKLREGIVKKTNQWGSEKSQLEIQIIELQAKLEAKNEMSASADQKLSLQVEALRKENTSLKVKLASLTKDLQARTMEMELVVKSAETASKHNFDSIKKIAKLEAECRRLHAAARKSLFLKDHKINSNSVYMESLTDSQSDCGERLASLDNEPSFSDSWASALIAELDQFKDEKASSRNLTNSLETDLMDDFLEMERLAAALPSADHGSSYFEHEADSDSAVIRDSSSRTETETSSKKIAELEVTIEKMAMENAELEKSLCKSQSELQKNAEQLLLSEAKLIEVQRQLNLVNGEKHALGIELEGAETKKSEVELQLEQAQKETDELQEKIKSLEGTIQEERLSAQKLLGRYQDMEVMVAQANQLKLELESANKKISKLQEKTTILERELDKERTISAELASKCQRFDALETKKKEVESQLKLANLELAKLREEVILLKKKAEEKVLSANTLKASAETEREKLKHQLKSANMEVQKLKENVILLEAELGDSKVTSAKLAADMEEAVTKREEMVVRHELACKEAANLREKLLLVEKQVEKEKAFSAELAANCQSLQYELSSKTQEAGLLKSARSNGIVKIRQDNEVAAAAGRLAECQKTIASLKLQVKSLATMDVIAQDMPESNGDSWKSNFDSRSSPKRLTLCS